MEKEFDILYLFLKKLPQLTECAAPIAKRSGILPQSALLLSVAEAFPDFVLSQEQYLSQLLEGGFVKLESGKIAVTGKGAILAKAVSDAKQKYYKNLLSGISPDKREALEEAFKMM